MSMSQSGHMADIRIESLRLGQLDTNCYLIWDESSGEGLIIDPAASGDTISTRVLELGFKPTGIVLTHGHFDHCLGLLEVKTNFFSPIYLHPADTFLLEGAAESAKHWLGIQPDPVPPANRTLTPSTDLAIGNSPIQIIETPGHTPGSVSLYLPEEELLISGDTLFHQAVGRTDFSYSSPADLEKSLQALVELPENVVILPGHGKASTIKAAKDFLGYSD
jgi:hydroxyacylglutathione hydrolase